MFLLENEYIKLEVNEDGELVSFKNQKNGREIVKRHSLHRLILGTPSCLEFEARPYKNPRITENKNKTISLEFDSVISENGDLFKIGIQAGIVLERDQVRWTLKLFNHTEDTVVRESHYPIISLAEPEIPAALLNSNYVSTRIPDIPAFLANSATGYMAPDHKYLRHSSVYPGRSCSLNFFLVDWGNDGFYYACHDPEFSMNFHSVEKEKNFVNCFIARLPFLKPGDVRQDDSIVSAPYSGQWTSGAARYRSWADSWFAAPDIPAHIRNMQGWQRIILHHQYGEYFYKYSELEKLYEDGLKAGLDTLFLFGWTAEGMDSGYPVYSPDEVQGGFQALRENIMKVRKRGGHVILYYNGQLIDTSSRYYTSGEGQRVSIKLVDGTEHREFYNFSNTGTFLQEFGNKTFVVACPSCREWIDILKKHIDFAIEVGADSVFFDQLGLASYPCCDPAHGHEVPFTGLMNTKRLMLKELYEYTKSKAPEMGFGIECTTDQTVSYTDFFHIFGNVAQVWNPDWLTKGEIPQFKSGAYLFKAAFPEAIISNRNLRDDNDVEFHVNRMFFLGSRSDVEIYRCRASIAATPRYQKYLGQANALRMRFSDILFNGKFAAAEFHSIDNPFIQSNAFVLGGKLALILTQSSHKTLSTRVSVPGYLFREYASVRSDVEFDGETAYLPTDSLVVILYEKKEIISSTQTGADNGFKEKKQ